MLVKLENLLGNLDLVLFVSLSMMFIRQMS